MSHRDNATIKRWAADAALAFCGYLTLATSAPPGPGFCPDVSTRLRRTFTPDGESNVTEWRLTAVSPRRVSRWEIGVEPAAALEYLSAGEEEVPVFTASEVAGLEASTGTGELETSSGDGSSNPTSDSSTGSLRRPLPPDHVVAAEGRMTLVCGGDPALCEDVRFAVSALQGESTEFTIVVTAVRVGCAPEGELTDLRLEPLVP